VQEGSDAQTLLAFSALIVALDRVTKSAVVTSLGADRPRSRLDIVDGWVALEYAENRGAAFGLFSGLAPVLAIASVVVLAVIVYSYWQEVQPPLGKTVAIGLILGGAIGNLIDRIWLGYVVDFIAIGPWPNFNVADSAISVGVVMLLWYWPRPGVRGGGEQTI
jgi:signal peptidase II